MPILKTATGKEIEVSMCVDDPRVNRLYVIVPNSTYSSLTKIFENPVETESLTYGINQYEHFTKLVGLNDEGDGEIRVSMEAVM